MPRFKVKKRIMPKLSGGREAAYLKVHPSIKRDLKAMAKSGNCSVNVLLNSIIIERWHYQDLEPGVTHTRTLLKDYEPKVLKFRRA